MANKFNIEIDDSDFQKLLDTIESGLEDMGKRALTEMADTLLELSRFEVPHDIGTLQSRGSVFTDDGIGVAYNIEYAAYQHEGGDGKRVIQHYQKGRKKKYLEDPLKLNISKWSQLAADELSRLIAEAG